MIQKMKIIKKLIFIFFLISILFISLLFYWQIKGLPKSIQTWIWEQIQNQGIEAKAGYIRFGLLDGIVLEDIKITDYSYNQLTLVSADKIQVKFALRRLIRGDVVVADLIGENCNLHLPFVRDAENNFDSLGFTNVDFSIKNFKDKIGIGSFSGFLDGVKVTIQGDVIKPTEEELLEMKQQRIKLLPFTCDNWLSFISEDVTDGLKSFQHFINSNSNLSQSGVALNVQFPIARPLESYVFLAANFNQFLYRGLNLEKLTLKGDFTQNILAISDFRLEMDNQEYVGGEAIWDLEREEISGLFSLTAYPHKILKVISPKLLEEYSEFIPLFKHKPLVATLRLNPSPISSPIDWNITMDLNANKMMIMDEIISSLNGQVKMVNKQCEFIDTSIRLKSDVEVLLNGTFELETKELMIQAAINGNPNFITSFTTDKQFIEKYRNIWKPFNWNDKDKPHIDLELIYNNKFPNLGLIINADCRMTNFQYNGVDIEQGTGHVVVDYINSLVLIDNLTVVSNNVSASGHIVIHGDRDELLFDIASNLHPPSLLQLFYPKWDTFLEKLGYVFHQHPYVKAHGRLFTKGDPQSDIAIELEGRELDFQDILIDEFSANLQIKNQRTKTIANIVSGQYDKWNFENVSLEIDSVSGGASTIKGNAIKIHGVGAILNDSEFTGTRTDQSIDVLSHSNTLSYGDWRLNDITATSVYDGKTLSSNSKIESAKFYETTFENVKLNFRVNGERIDADIAVEEAGDDLTFQITDLNSKCVLENSDLSLTGTVVEFFHYPTQGICNDIVLDGTYINGQLQVDMSTPYFICLDDTELVDVNLGIVYNNNDLWGDYKIKNFSMGDLTGINVTGSYNRQGSSWLFQNQLDKAAIPIAEFNTVTTSGIISNDMVRTSVFAEKNRIYDFPVNNITASIVNELDELTITRIAGNLFGGTTTGDISYNFEDESGKIWLTFIDVNFGELISNLKGENSRIKAGKLSCKIDVNYDNSDPDVLLDGNGKLMVEDGDLWQVPFISDFLGMLNSQAIIGKVLPKNDLGKITNFRSNLNFKGKNVELPDFRTNGNLIAISARGDYGLNSQELDFHVKAEPLKPFFGQISKLLPKVVDPFVLLLERRLTGTIRKPKWEASIRDMFRSKEKVNSGNKSQK